MIRILLSRNRCFLISVKMLIIILVCSACNQDSIHFFPTNTFSIPTVSPSSRPTGAPNTTNSTNSVTVTPRISYHIDVHPTELRGSIIHFWHPWSGSAGTLIQALVEDFNLHNEWGIMVVPVLQATQDEISNNLVASIGTGDMPDLVVGSPHQYLEWNEMIKLLDLSPYEDDAAWGLSLEEQADFNPVVWEQDVLDGKRLGIPAQRSAQVLFYNQTWAKSLGFKDPPASPEQFMEQACSAAHHSRQDNDPSNDGSGGYLVSHDYATMLGWIYSFGGEVIQTPEPGLGKSVYQFNTPEVEETFIFLRDLYDQLCAWQSEDQYPLEEFASRQGLFFVGNVMDIPSQVTAFRQEGNRDTWTVIPFPSPNKSSAVDVFGTSFVILPSTPQRQLAAWLLIKHLMSPENHALLIEETSALPVRSSSLEKLEKFQDQFPQWKAALGLLALGRSEPFYGSWSMIRWALSDATRQLFRNYFSVDQVPDLIEYLDDTAAELHLGPEASGVLWTSTSTPTITTTPSKTPTPSPTSKAIKSTQASPTPPP